MLDPQQLPGIRGDGPAARRAADLLGRLGIEIDHRDGPDELDPAHRWAQCGGMWLTGEPEAPPRALRGALAAGADGALLALRALAGPGWAGPDRGAELLGERAALAGLRRRGRVAPGGACQLLRCADGWLAVNLPRADDRALLPAWLECEIGPDPWDATSAAVAARATGELEERAHLLGLAVAAVRPAGDIRTPPVGTATLGPAINRNSRSDPVVLDLSALWAGPLCASLLGMAGARVIRLESARRPDGARRGPPAFFDLLHAGQPSVALDLTSTAGVDDLRRVLERVDVVVESARPRGLEQLGVRAADWLAAAPGRTWVSITGHGREGPRASWVAFGDDAAAAAGLVWATAPSGDDPVFCADACADPLAGLHAAVLAAASWRLGGGHLLDVPLVGAAAVALGPAEPLQAEVRRRGAAGWEVCTPAGSERVAPPRARPAAGRARSLGADTEAILAGC